MQKIKSYISFPIILLGAMVLFVVLGACKKNMDTTDNLPPYVPANPPVDIPATGKTYLALGDSYTIGQSVGASERFPAQTAAILAAQGVTVNPPVYIATTGWTTGDLLSSINSNPPASNYDIVTLLIGVNNQYQGRSLQEYKSEFTTLLLKAIQYAGNRKSHVVVLSIPDYSVTPYAAGMDKVKIAREIDEFNAANKEITLAMGVQYLDITPISREGANDATMQAGDGLHPSGKQYGRWSALLAPMIKASL